MTALSILYSFRRCPYAMRARMAIAVSGVQVELREAVLREKPTEMLEVSPKGTVPVLLLPDGQVLEESLDIMHWALGQNDREGWLASEHAELIERNDSEFKSALDRYKYPQRHGLSDGLAHRKRGFAFVEHLDSLLAEKPFLTGMSRGMADIAIFPFVRQFVATDIAWFEQQRCTQVQRWLSGLSSSELFTEIMARYPRWHPGDVRMIFPT